MNGFAGRTIPKLNDHLSAEQAANLICRELPLGERLIARSHLARCRQCRALRADLEGWRAQQMMDLYCAAIEREEVLLSNGAREQFLARLESRIRSGAAGKRPVAGRERRVQVARAGLSGASLWLALRLLGLDFGFLKPALRSLKLAIGSLNLARRSLKLTPASAVGIVLSAAAVAWFCSLWQLSLPPMSSTGLLAQAERWDTAGLRGTGDVVFQSVRIVTPERTIERSIYRDVQGRRRVRQAASQAKDDGLESTLLRAGVDWDQPISAANYQGWHDHQEVREDRIVHAGEHLLQLITTVPQGTIAEESLTVRDTDFHPLRRTVGFRDRRTIEIAEVDFKVLPWSAVDATIFEPLAGPAPSMASAPARIVSLPRMPERVSDEELEATELGARLILNQLHADTGEQIAISRGPQAVEVDGLVETAERRRELQMQLHVVPHLKVDIRSVAELKDDPSGARESASGSDVVVSSSPAASIPGDMSPLETLLRSRGESVSLANAVARRLFDSALAIGQESRAIDDLQGRFAAGKTRSVIASATVLQLVESHRERLLQALQEERRLLVEARGEALPEGEELAGSGERNGSEEQEASTRLAGLAQKNLALCKELTAADGAATRGAGDILAAMSAAAAALKSEAASIDSTSHIDSALHGRR